MVSTSLTGTSRTLPTAPKRSPQRDDLSSVSPTLSPKRSQRHRSRTQRNKSNGTSTKRVPNFPLETVSTRSGGSRAATHFTPTVKA
jgi:hypothetical protein